MHRFHMSISRKTRLNAAFADMRARGLIARQNFMCCNGCAAYELGSRVGEKIAAGKNVGKIKGVVFYTKQDNDRLFDEGMTYLSFGKLECSLASGKTQIVGLDDFEVAKIVCEELQKHGIPYEWNGDVDTRILARVDLIGAELSIVRRDQANDDIQAGL